MRILSNVLPDDWELDGSSLKYSLDYPLFPARDEDRKKVEDNGGGNFYAKNGEWRYKKPQKIEVPSTLVDVVEVRVGQALYLEVEVEEVTEAKRSDASTFKRSLVGVYNTQEVVEKQKAAIAAAKK